MPSDYESGAKKTIDISIKAEKMTADVLKSVLQEFLSGKAEKKGRMTYKQLQVKSASKLDSIEVSDRNIGDFLKTARKYDVDFALKRDKSTSPPATRHISVTLIFSRGFVFISSFILSAIHILVRSAMCITLFFTEFEKCKTFYHNYNFVC